MTDKEILAEIERQEKRFLSLLTRRGRRVHVLASVLAAGELRGQSLLIQLY